MSIQVKDANGVTQTVETPSAVGQALMVASKPVVIASNQSAVPVSGTVAATQSGTWNIGAITTLPAVVVSGTVTANVGTGTQPVSGTVAATQSGTWNIGSITTLPTLPQLPAALGTTGALKVELPASQLEGGEYEAVPSTVSTTTMLGTTGAIGDFLSSITVTPLTTSPGSISIKDGSATAILVFQGGASSVSNLVPFTINIGAACTGVGWQIVTGSGGNVQALAVGNFT